MRPRLPALPDGILPRDRFPTLYHLADTVPHACGVVPVDAIVIDERFNTAFGLAGWQGKEILYLGLPLLTILNARERGS